MRVMLFGLVPTVEPLKNMFDRERELVLAELIDEALGEQEITTAIELHEGISTNWLRDAALAASKDLLQTAAIEEERLRTELRTLESYEREHLEVPHWLARIRDPSGYLLILVFLLGVGASTWFVVHDWIGSTAWAYALAVAASILSIALLYIIDDKSNGTRTFWWACLLDALSGYAVFVISGRGWSGIALAIGTFLILFPFGFLNSYTVESNELLQEQMGVKRYIPSRSILPAYELWRATLREAGVLPYLRNYINKSLLKQYSVVLSVEEAPGLRYLGDLKYHVATAAREDLIRRIDGVEGGSFALAGPRGAGKTILMRAFCAGRFAAAPRRDIGVVVSAPVDYEARDFVLYLYAEVCKKTKAYVEERKSPALAVTRSARSTIVGLRMLRPFRQRVSSVTPVTLSDLARLADEKLSQARYLQTFSTEISGKIGVSATEVAAKAATSLAEQPLTYPEIVADLRNFLETVTYTMRAQTVNTPKDLAGPESSPRMLIGIDELDRIGSGERARKFLDDIKAIFWVRGCYFIVSVSEDALRAFELAGHGMRDVFDSAFDEVIAVEHLDYEASANLLRVRVVGLSAPYHALAYCLSGGLPRELMRVARAITEQQDLKTEIRLARVTANLVANDLNRHCHAARIALVGIEDANKAAELMRLLDQGCRPVDDHLRKFAEEAKTAAVDCSDTIRSLADAIATHAYYLVALSGFFTDQLPEKDVNRASDKSQPISVRFDALAHARRYLGVNDTFARTLIDAFLEAWDEKFTSNLRSP